MLEQPPLWLVLIAFVCAIGPLVFFHELGHYLVGKLFGVGVETFSINFGREIVGWTDRSGTRWKVGWLPLGGYVRFVGDEDRPGQGEGQPDHDPKSFAGKPVWQGFVVVLAGRMANFLLAILIFAAFIAANGAPRTPAIVASVLPGSPAATIGLQRGDRIVGIDSKEVRRFDDLADYSRLRPNEDSLVIARYRIIPDFDKRELKPKLGS